MKEILLRRTYCDILQGYSLDQKSGLFIKHLTNLDQADFDYIYYLTYQSLKEEGVQTEEELKELLENIGEWTKDNEKEIVYLKDYISRLKETKAKLMRKTDKDEVDKELAEYEKKLNELENKKYNLFSQSCESFAASKQSNAYIVGSIYKDKEMNIRYLTNEEFNEIDDEEFGKLIEIYNRGLSNVNESKIKNLACNVMFQQPFRLVESLYDFFGKPVASLTFYQILLGAYGRTFKSIFENHEIPEKISDNPDEVLEYVTVSKEIKNKIENRPNNTNMVGFSSEDYERLGMKKPDNIAEVFEQKGTLSKEEIIKMKSEKF